MYQCFNKRARSKGSEIKRLRESLSFTQQELSDRCDIDIRTIQRIEKGEHGVGLQILIALAVSLETTPSELLSKLKIPAAGKPRF